MLYVRQPTDEERKELERMIRQGISRVSQRAQMILLPARRKKVPKIADAFDVCLPGVRFWTRRFDEYGPDGLHDRSSTT